MPTRRIPLLAAVLALTAVLAALRWVWTDQAQVRQGAIALAPPPTGGDFQLGDGEHAVNLEHLRGRVVLVYFGYTWCPDICPTNLAFIAAALKTLTPDELARTQVLFISVDPDRDDPRRLLEYAGWFHPRIRGVTGRPDQIAAAARRYGAAYRRVEETGSAMGYLIDHSADTYVIDPRGRLVLTLHHASPPASIAAAIRSHLGKP